LMTSSSAHHSRHMLAAPASAVVRPWAGAMHAPSHGWPPPRPPMTGACGRIGRPPLLLFGRWGMGRCCMGYMTADDDRGTAAASRAGHLAAQPGLPARVASVREWMVTALGVQQRRGWPALPRRAVRRGQHLTIQLPSCSPTAFDHALTAGRFDRNRLNL
jgi:hypothetical protein